MATYQELRTRSQQVRDEQNIGGNTALRVGQLLMDIVKYFNDNDEAASEYLQQHFAMVNDGTQLLNWQQSPIVILHTMGETYDDGDFSALSQGENYYRAGFIMEANGQGGGINGETPKANVLYVNLANDTLYTWNGSSFDAITSGGGGGSISGDDIIKNAYYSNGNLVLIIETEGGDKTVTIPVTFDASNYVPTSRTVNGKELSNNITLSQSDIPGLVAALAAKIGYSDDEWLQVKAGAMQAATAVPNTTTVNGKRLNDNIVIGMADIPGLETAIGEAGKVKTVSVNNGTPAQPDSNGNVNIQVQTGSTISPATATPSMDGTANVGSSAKYAREDHVHPHDTTKLSKSDVSVETQGDGTVDINVKDDTYTINLNHTHEGMAKLVVDTAANLPDASEMESDTIYGELDDGEIATIYLGGYPFYGGGGGASSGPVLRRPADGATIDIGQTTSGTVSKTINVKGKSLTQALTIELTGTGYSFGTTQPSGVTRDSATQLTIPASSISAVNSLNGVDIVVVYTGSDTDEDASGTLGITSASPDSISTEATLVANAHVYEDLRGVKLTGSQWLQTDYYPNANTEFEMTCHFIENTNSSLIDSNNNKGYLLNCATNEGDDKKFMMYNLGPTNATPNNAYGILFINESSAQYGSNSYQLVRFEKSINTFLADNLKIFYRKSTSNGVIGIKSGGTEYTANTSLKTSTMESPMCIGKAVDDTIYCRFDLVIYELKITENGTVVRDWVPKEKYGVPGLLDIAANGTGTFLSSETNDELVAIPLT